MEAIASHLPQIWLFLIAFFLLYYVATDGSDLGIGILSLLAADDKERGLLMQTIGSVWHGHQTWLVLLGGMLFGAFPVFYAVLLSSLYIPMMCMLLGLALRGVAFEFRARSGKKGIWSLCFGVGSLIAAGAQGFALGGLLGGLDIRSGQFTGNVWGWLDSFSIMVTAGVIAGYTMLGANYLIMKTAGRIQEKSYRYARAAAMTTLIVTIFVHLLIVFRYPVALEKWAGLSLLSGLFGLLCLFVFSFVMYFTSLSRRKERAPFIWNVLLIIFSFSVLSISLYPNMIPNLAPQALTVQAAAASSSTLGFMLVTMAVLLPVILAYTTMTYRIFRGKIESPCEESDACRAPLSSQAAKRSA
ncbi:MAG: cytochrome d ubiquinol oxidase subunit II [Desulfohalobiaceae bacterium]|nr:cytochrome d ubiquinol oxidase subunit II [Desulfohalobiaceae bacterium]